MKKGTIIALIVAVALLLGGGVMLVLGLSFAGEGLQKSLLSEQEIMITETVDSIVINTGDCNVTVVPYNGTADAKIVIREREETSHSVSVEDGTLKVQMVDNRQWEDFIGVNWESMEMTVYLPETEYASLRITASTGDIRIPEAFSAKEMLLRVNTGDIACEGMALEMLDCFTSTGDIFVRNGGQNAIELTASTGEINLKDAKCMQIHLKNGTGKTNLENVVCEKLACQSSTGDVTLKSMLAEEYLQVSASTGDVRIQDSDAAQIEIKTSTGDVHLPAGWESKDSRIETSTGDIHFK